MLRLHIGCVMRKSIRSTALMVPPLSSSNFQTKFRGLATCQNVMERVKGTVIKHGAAGIFFPRGLTIGTTKTLKVLDRQLHLLPNWLYLHCQFPSWYRSYYPRRP
jgi:hypothetical protein